MGTSPSPAWPGTAINWCGDMRVSRAGMPSSLRLEGLKQGAVASGANWRQAITMISHPRILDKSVLEDLGLARLIERKR
jgi:hypothetical protein